MKKIVFLLISILTIGLYSCKSDFIGQYSVESNPPDPVSNVTFDSLPGAVKLTYKLPTNPDLMAVKATYFLDNGTKMEAEASAYTNQLLIEGFGTADSMRTVSIVTIDLNQNASKPVIIKVKPKKSPIYDIFKSIKADKDFGGIYLKWKNPTKSNIIVVVTTPDKAGNPVVALGGKFYSNLDSATVNIRGYDSIPRTFYIQVMDRWGNKTKADTLKNIKPLFEQMISKAYHARWNGDPTIPYQEYNSSFGISCIWDNKYGSTSGGNCFSTKSGGGISNSITYDLNSMATASGKGWIQPSRIKLYGRSGYGYSPIGEYVRIWGSTSPTVSTTNTSGPNAWILLGPAQGYHITPPSGATGLNATSDDKAYLENTGYDIVFPPGTPAIRYVRIEMVSMWGGANNTSFNIGEITWYGRVL